MAGMAGNIIVWIILGIVLLLISNYFAVRMQNKVIFSWWKTYGGSQYSQYLNFYNFIASRQSYVWYGITKAFGNIFNSLNRVQIQFIEAAAFTQVCSPDPTTGLLTGFMKPRHLCVSVTFAPGEDDQADAWATQTGRQLDSVAQYTWNPAYLVESGAITDSWVRPSKPSLVSNNKGCYPDPGDIDGWICKLIEWGCMGFYWNRVSGNSYRMPVLAVPGHDDYGKNAVQEWFGIKDDGSPDPSWAHADNFLARYGIPYDSDLIIGLINQSWFTSGNQLSNYGLRTLLQGQNGEAGGWVGMTQTCFSDDTSFEQMMRICFASVSPPKALPGAASARPDTCSGAAITGSVVNTLGSALGAGMCFPFPADLVVGLGVGLLSFFGSGTSKCL